MTDDRKGDSPKRSLTGIRELGESVERKCDSIRRDVKGIREVCQLTEKCDGYEGCVRMCGKV